MSFRTLSLRLLPLLLGAISLQAQVARYEPQPIADEESFSRPAPDWLMPFQTLDRRLPSWLSFGGMYRSRIEAAGHHNFTPDNDGYLLSQLRFWLVLKPMRWFTVVGETQDARIFFNQVVTSGGSNGNRWDIRQAYVQIGSPIEGWFTLTVGRQIFSFGDERLIGPSDWVNMGRTFDAVRLDVHRGGNEVSLFASSVIVPRDGVLDHHNEGNNLHGAYASLKQLVPKATVEPYVLWRLAPGRLALSENGDGRGALNEVTTGLRWVGKLPHSFDYSLEMAKQSGSLGPYSIHAWAGHWEAGKTFGASLKPRVFLESNYASGASNPAGRSWGTFDQLYPSGHDKLGFADQVGWRNIKQIRTGVEEKIGKQWKLKQSYESFWLASTRDAFYGNNGSISVPAATFPVSSHVAQELDLTFEYQYDKALSTGFGYAQVFAGEFLKRTTDGRDYEYPYGYVTYRF